METQLLKAHICGPIFNNENKAGYIISTIKLSPYGIVSIIIIALLEVTMQFSLLIQSDKQFQFDHGLVASDSNTRNSFHHGLYFCSQ